MIFLQSRNRDTDVENKLTDTKKEVGEGEVRWIGRLEYWHMYTTRYKIDNWWEWLYNTRNSSLFMEFSRHKYWSSLPIPTPGDLPNPGIEPTSLVSPASAGGFFTTSATWEAIYVYLIRFAIQQKLTQHWKATIPSVKKKSKRCQVFSSPCTHTKERPYEHIAEGNCH